MGVVAASSVATGNILPPAANEDDAGAEMSEKVQTHFEELRNFLDTLNGAVFGKPGYEQDLIPEAMLGSDWENPAVGALSDGRWLTADPTRGLDESMEKMYNRMVST